jgi:hypothetical protein
VSLELGSLAEACEVVPERTEDPARAREVVFDRGAVVLSGLGTSEATAEALAAVVLGPRLVASGHPIEVTDGGGVDRRLTADAARRMLPLHTDGFSFGAQAPDVFFLLCSVPSDHDGGSFLVDQQRLLIELGRSAEGRELAEFVTGHDVDQSAPGGFPAVGPIALPLPSGISAVRRSLDVRPRDDDPDPARVDRLLTLWQGVLDAVGALAVRFHLGAGEALAIDNTRMAHGRDGYTTPGRLLWRCWAWTDRAGGVPDGELWSDTRMVPHPDSLPRVG